MNPKLSNISVKVGHIVFEEDGAGARLSDESIVPLLRDQGPAEVFVQKGEIAFGDIRQLLELRPGTVALIYEEERLALWTFLPWLDGAMKRLSVIKALEKRRRETETRSIEDSRRQGLQKARRLVVNHRRTQDAPSAEITGEGYRALHTAHDEAQGAFEGAAFAGLKWPDKKAA